MALTAFAFCVSFALELRSLLSVARGLDRPEILLDFGCYPIPQNVNYEYFNTLKHEKQYLKILLGSNIKYLKLNENPTSNTYEGRNFLITYKISSVNFQYHWLS